MLAGKLPLLLSPQLPPAHVFVPGGEVSGANRSGWWVGMERGVEAVRGNTRFERRMPTKTQDSRPMGTGALQLWFMYSG